ncbi:GLPGLI family protein [uncultured Culturomica sp.]|uniref:GLPGLI family protein n=1 Tax=uncultured Culturomica sp. TaxID=1926654 RepID=UPI002592479F|nr:GLPGLI family protein [uncultured Culturomica sp.]
MKIILLFSFALGIQFSLFAQNIVFKGNIEDVPRKMEPRDTLDCAYLNVHYRQLIRKDKLFPEELTGSDMVLQIGEQVSKYSNYRFLVNDSIMTEELRCPKLNITNILNQATMRTKNAGDRSVVIKNYPKGQYWVRVPVLLNKYIYMEREPVFDWIFTSDTLTVLGYLCKKATCLFRGRYYTAWYAPDIPLSNGPWKFNGLPGLILKVEDADRDYSFECTALYRVDWKSPIYLSKRKKDIETTREKFRQAEKAAMNNPNAVIGNSGLVTVPKGEKIVTKILPYNPIELE